MNPKIIFFSLFFIILSPLAFSTEKIVSFDVLLEPQRDGIIVTEKITYKFPEQAIKRGIYRDIITQESRDIFENSLNYGIGLEILEVTNERGNPYHYLKNKLSDGLRIKIGRSNKYVKGIKTYIIKYKVFGAIRFFESHDEIYWNATGHYWSVRIEKARVRIKLPSNLELLADKYVTYTGYYGQKKTLPTHTSFGLIESQTDTLLRPNQGISIIAGFKKGFFKEPTSLEKLGFFLSGNPWLKGLIILPLIVFFVMLVLFFKFGREVHHYSPVVKYDAPEGLSPAQVGALYDDRVNLSDIVSIIMDMAAKGQWKIELKEETGLLWFKNQIVKFTLNDDKINIYKGLMEYERTVKERFEGAAKAGELTMEDLKYKFAKVIPEIESEILKSIEPYYRYSPHKIVKVTTMVTILIAIGFYIFYDLFPILKNFLETDISFIIGIFFSYFIVSAFLKVMPRKNRKGARIYSEILGYKDFLEKVEVETLKKMLTQDPRLFEHHLPYAVALGCLDDWSDKFEHLKVAKPHWYSGHRNFNTRSFVTSMNASVANMASTISATQRSSGSSVFSGGGGFSGGGSGGGGGGSW